MSQVHLPSFCCFRNGKLVFSSSSTVVRIVVVVARKKNLLQEEEHNNMADARGRFVFL